MIINGRPVAEGMGTAELQRLAARRGEELGPSNGFINLAFGMMNEQEWQQYKQIAADGAAKSESYAKAGDARWDAWARENAALAWLSSPDAAQRSVPSPAEAVLPVETMDGAEPAPAAVTDVDAPALVAAVEPNGASAFIETAESASSTGTPAPETASTERLLDELAMSLRFAGTLARQGYDRDA